ncbi:hypothetical protein TSUD_48680 [Trifolium subterraneum]|uniref:Cyclase family protein n=1 Tax=Trifolium subterraneum TaxID=3900 RepID=A0A2Z6LXK0_TRISU|nr:hypothetical protein TSUD_48680 [Trifolium subterraneum]
MNSLSIFAFFCAISVAAASKAYPSVPGLDSGDCSFTGDETTLVPPRREVYDDGKIYDISHRYVPTLPVWDSEEGLGHFLWLAYSIKNGSRANGSAMQIGAHTGTHVDAPGHFYDNYYDAGFDVDSLDLRLLNDVDNWTDMPMVLFVGLTLLVDVPRVSNITAEVMKSLNIPKGVKRVLFRTLNTDRRLMFKKEFDTSYVGFLEDGAKWLVENTDIKLVGLIAALQILAISSVLT